MEKLQIRKRREIQSQPSHPIREMMPILLLEMTLTASPPKVTQLKYGSPALRLLLLKEHLLHTRGLFLLVQSEQHDKRVLLLV